MSNQTKSTRDGAEAIPIVRDLLALPVGKNSSALKEMDAWVIADYIAQTKQETIEKIYSETKELEKSTYTEDDALVVLDLVLAMLNRHTAINELGEN
jgi:hypothetical protein